ncbi:hypothetical protein V1512DRAFT_234056 [Lipomyces arxii]|uniref:uncharacterized protein n=1 Tax=Lipomyces arxii TaxID=56418 RepID=UPI0034CF2BDF
MKLTQMQTKIGSAEYERQSSEQALSNFIISSSPQLKAVIRLSQEHVWLQFQTSGLDTERARLGKAKRIRDETNAKLLLRREILDLHADKLRDGLEVLREYKQDLNIQRESLTKVGVAISVQRSRICHDLEKIYPIEPIVGKSFAFSIRGVELPNSDYVGIGDDLLGTALGYTAHLVYLLSFYLGVQLRYPIYPSGNKSYIEDPVSIMTGSRTFPLWRKGSTYIRFEYGVFLLNKSVGQLMNAFALEGYDLRNTLPNLKCLLLAIGAAED